MKERPVVTRSRARRPRRRAFLAGGLALAGVVLSAVVVQPSAAEPTPTPAPAPTTRPGAEAGSTPDGESRAVRNSVEPGRRDRVLARGWRTSADLAWTTVGDDTGFHVLVSRARDGYAWRTAATLSEPGFDTDQWIGNACLTASGRRLVVVYAPRSFTNRPELAQRGGFTAVVDLVEGSVRKLAVTGSLAYFNPGCGVGERAVLTQEGTEDRGATRLVGLDAATGTTARSVTVRAQITSVVPTGSGLVGVTGHRIVRISDRGARTPLTRTPERGVPFDLVADPEGGVVYSTVAGATVRVHRLTGGTATQLAEAPVGSLRTRRGSGNRVFLAGRPTSVADLPDGVRPLAVPADADVSTTGALALNVRTDRSGVRLDAVVPATREKVAFTLNLAPGAPASGAATSPSLRTTAATASAVGSPTDPVDADRYCSVPRNDVRTQVYQPTPRQVEWAADQAVAGALTLTRPAGWKGGGLPAYSPQGWFPSIPLSGGGQVPPQLLLGIFAQESNLWQATKHAQPGEYGNPLVGNFYGRAIYDANESDDWVIDWSKADCGYGIGQFTDGMRLAGHARDGEVLLPADRQRAVAFDYATNIAASLRLLQTKWNQTRDAGLTVNNGTAAGLENWFFAVWAYNSGFYPQSTAGTRGGAWGVGWLNNPINPRYDPNRLPFLERSMADAREPQKWPYQEKVLGFAGHSIDTIDGPGFKPAWWNSDYARVAVKPPSELFCDASNQCRPGAKLPNDVEPDRPGPCSRSDLLCYYHQPVTWKTTCESTCGVGWLRFDPGYPEQPDGDRFRPICNLNGLPAGALVIDDLPDSVPRSRCSTTPNSAGTFGLRFPTADSSGHYPAKVDLHQLAGGYGSHFWFAHTQAPGANGGVLAVTGTWRLNQRIDGWARVLVHMPDHGAHTRQAKYVIDLGNGKLRARVAQQRTREHRWVSLGVRPFAGVPSVSLSSVTYDGRGVEDVAWDAVAFQKLPAKPKDIVVAMGDSYSSGEGASVTGGGDYYKESDVDGADPPWRDACHRSKYAWSRKARLPGNTTAIGARADSFDPTLDYHLIACSGAQTENLLPLDGSVANFFGERGSPEYGELPQVDQGYLDEYTTLVTLSIGGNDARFSDIVKQCIYAALANFCPDIRLGGDTRILRETEPELIRGPVRRSIVIVLNEIHRRAPNARIVLMGYPILVEGRAATSCDLGFDVPEITWLAQMGDLMAQEMAGAAVEATLAGAPTTFSDPRSQFAGKGICGIPETIHGIVVDKTPGDEPGLTPPNSTQSFHPKIEGTTLYANALNRTLGS